MAPSVVMPSSSEIQEGKTLCIDDCEIEVLSYIGQLSDNVRHFEIKFGLHPNTDSLAQTGLMRVGLLEGSLARELRIRSAFKDFKMISTLEVSNQVKDAVVNIATDSDIPVSHQDSSETISIDPSQDSSQGLAEKKGSEQLEINDAEISQDTTDGQEVNTDRITDCLDIDADRDGFISKDVHAKSAELESLEQLSKEIVEERALDKLSQVKANFESDEIDHNYLEEESHALGESVVISGETVIVFVSSYPEKSQMLSTWIERKHSLEENLSIVIQICQFFRQVHERGWCFVHFLPRLVQISKPIQFHDLTYAYKVGQTLDFGLQGEYSAPELCYGNVPIHESMSSYTITALLYQLICGKIYHDSQYDELDSLQLPRIYQLLKTCLSPVPEDRFSLDQLLDILVDIRQVLRAGTINWEVAHRSTVGLSLSRMQNEDNFGVRQLQLNSNSFILGVLADGMGGLSEGDVASSLAVRTLLEEPIEETLKEPGQYAKWLENLFQKANDVIEKNVQEGGTTLSAVLAINRSLILSHVGDSRIYLLRRGSICRLSEDHSLVAMLVASGEITPQESLEHPERNVLTKALGSKKVLTNGYIQTLEHWGSPTSIGLEDGDILLLCSDGVWDLISEQKLFSIFEKSQSVQKGVDIVIDLALKRGALDNATILALKLSFKKVC